MPIVIVENTIVTKEFLRVFAIWVDAKTQERTERKGCLIVFVWRIKHLYRYFIGD